MVRSNVIVRNIEIVGFGVGNCALDPGFDRAVGCSSGDDAIIIQRDSHHVWFDHCIVRDGTDGNLDITQRGRLRHDLLHQVHVHAPHRQRRE